MLVLAHTGRESARRSATQVIERLTGAGVAVRVTEAEVPELECVGATVVPAGPKAAEDAELVIVLGGDGTLLRAAELARPAGTPLIGVNLGHVGFLADAEPDGLTRTVDHLLAGDYRVEERMTIDVTARENGSEIARTWALNEMTVEKAARERVIEVVHADRLDRLRLLGRRPGGLARGRGAAHGAAGRARPVRPSAGRLPERGACRGAGQRVRRASRARRGRTWRA
jgi:NAD kinase